MDNNQYIEAVKEIRDAILRSRFKVAANANKELLSLYFGIGEFVSRNSRNGFWGKNAIDSISDRLQIEMEGLRGFSPSNIKNMRVFYENWSRDIPEFRQSITGEIEASTLPGEAFHKIQENKLLLIRQLSTGELATDLFNDFLSIGFTHHIEILTKVKPLEERIFYIHECAKQSWSIETLKYNLRSNLFARQGSMPNNFLSTIESHELSRRAIRSFKDEYLLDYIAIGDPDNYDERVLETEIVNNIKKFILSFGDKFCFIGNQFRIIAEEEEFFIDLLFFNREISALIAIELKRGKFKAEYLGKMSLYLSILDDKVKLPHENPSIGIILCTEMKEKLVEYAVRDFNKPMGVATYRTQAEMPDNLKSALPDIEELKNYYRYNCNITARSKKKNSTFALPVIIAQEMHLFPFRTEKLNPGTPMVLRRRGRVGNCRTEISKLFIF